MAKAGSAIAPAFVMIVYLGASQSQATRLAVARMLIGTGPSEASKVTTASRTSRSRRWSRSSIAAPPPLLKIKRIKAPTTMTKPITDKPAPIDPKSGALLPQPVRRAAGGGWFQPRRW